MPHFDLSGLPLLAQIGLVVAGVLLAVGVARLLLRLLGRLISFVFTLAVTLGVLYILYRIFF